MPLVASCSCFPAKKIPILKKYRGFFLDRYVPNGIFSYEYHRIFRSLAFLTAAHLYAWVLFFSVYSLLLAHTLLYEPGFDTLRGQEAVLKYARSNKNNLPAKEINDFSQRLYSEISASRDMG